MAFVIRLETSVMKLFVTKPLISPRRGPVSSPLAVLSKDFSSFVLGWAKSKARLLTTVSTLVKNVGFNRPSILLRSPPSPERIEEMSARAAISTRLAASSSVGVGVASTRAGKRSPVKKKDKRMVMVLLGSDAVSIFNELGGEVSARQLRCGCSGTQWLSHVTYKFHTILLRPRGRIVSKQSRYSA